MSGRTKKNKQRLIGGAEGQAGTNHECTGRNNAKKKMGKEKETSRREKKKKKTDNKY